MNTPMNVSVVDLFSIGIGPSSSHTVGPMRAAGRFVTALADDGLLTRTARVQVELFGSLAATGLGHSTDRAVLLGLAGQDPETVEPDRAAAVVTLVRQQGQLDLLGTERIGFEIDRDLVMLARETLPRHPNGMRFTAYTAGGDAVHEATMYSVGGGFVVEGGSEDDAGGDSAEADAPPYPFASGGELLGWCATQQLPMSAVMLANECALRSEADVLAHLDRVWSVMQDCVDAGCATEGTLPGGLAVRRRAPQLYRRLTDEGADRDPLRVVDWINLFALAVNEENAGGGRVVTAPTNGAAGIIPAVLHYYVRFCDGADAGGVRRFLLAAGAVGSLYKRNASISGAEVGCQGEVGSASSMAAAGLCEVLGGTPRQVENAAEIAMEHNLGLTCDPVAGLVQVPCIERNAMAAVKAVNAARLALNGDGEHRVSLDQVIATMRQTGADMASQYKETSLGGLAVNVIEC
ncbi:L-serine dehydratase [Prauserella flava]|nr:L-serine dehydratase [Prauserella flava]MCR3736063.1 L-serine dehydratase [Prauserella salsuginis]